MDNKLSEFVAGITRSLPNSFYSNCLALPELHEIHCVVWNELYGKPQFEVKWKVNNLSDMEEATNIAKDSVIAINKDIAKWLLQENEYGEL